MIAYNSFSIQLHLHIFNSGKIRRVELCTELFYAIISTLVSLLFSDQLPLHPVTFSMFFFFNLV